MIEDQTLAQGVSSDRAGMAAPRGTQADTSGIKDDGERKTAAAKLCLVVSVLVLVSGLGGVFGLHEVAYWLVAQHPAPTLAAAVVVGLVGASCVWPTLWAWAVAPLATAAVAVFVASGWYEIFTTRIHDAFVIPVWPAFVMSVGVSMLGFCLMFHQYRAQTGIARVFELVAAPIWWSGVALLAILLMNGMVASHREMTRGIEAASQPVSQLHLEKIGAGLWKCAYSGGHDSVRCTSPQ